MPIKLTIHTLQDRVKRLEDLSGSIQDASNEISSITNNLIQKQNLDAFLTSELFPNIDSSGPLLSSSGIMLSAVDKALLTVGYDKFTSGKYYTTGNEVKAGRWGLFMEPSVLTIGIPSYAGNDTNKAFQVVTYDVDSLRKKNLIYAKCGTNDASSSVGIGPIFGRENLSSSGSMILGVDPFVLDPVIDSRLNSLYESPATHKKNMTFSVAGNMQIRSGSNNQEGNLNVQNDITTKFLYVDSAGTGDAKFKVTSVRTEIKNGLWIHEGTINDDDVEHGTRELNKYVYLIANSGWTSDLTDDTHTDAAARWELIVGNTGWYNNAGGRIMCTEIDFISDSRNKEIINYESNFDKYKLINVVDYYLKNDNNKEIKKGVLAQQIEQVFPKFVKKTKGLVADIFQPSLQTSILENGRVKIVLENSTDLKAGDVVEVIERNQQKNSLQVLEVLSPTVFIVESFNFDINEPVFVYGRYVNDYKTVDYNKIHMTTVEVVQELIKKTETLESENVQLKNTLAQFEARLASLESKA